MRVMQRVFTHLVMISLLAGGAVIGAVVAVEAFADMRADSSLAQIDVQVHVASSGSMELRVPLVDWGVRVDTGRVPLRVQAQVSSVDRSAAKSALGPDFRAPAQTAETLHADSRKIIRQVMRRALLCAIIGAVCGAMLVGAMLGALLHRRHLVGHGIAVGLVVVLAAGAPILVGLRDLQKIDASDTSYVGNAHEMARVVAFAEQLLYVREDYSILYERALGSAGNIIDFADEATDEQGEAVRSYLVASDLHDNVLVLDAFDNFAKDKTVFMPGDFGQVGASIEARLTPEIAQLGGQVIAVSGNHDSTAFMRSLAGSGVLVLTRNGVLRADGSIDTSRVIVQVDGQKVAGYDDPLERPDQETGHDLRVYGDEYEQQVSDLIRWYDGLTVKPDVLLIHQHGLAHRLAEHLHQQSSSARLVILTGHDHIAHVQQLGKQLIVDGGSIGAGGPFAVGEQPASFAQVNTRAGSITSIDMVSVDPVRGDGDTRRVAIKAGEDIEVFAREQDQQG